MTWPLPLILAPVLTALALARPVPAPPVPAEGRRVVLQDLELPRLFVTLRLRYETEEAVVAALMAELDGPEGLGERGDHLRFDLELEAEAAQAALEELAASWTSAGPSIEELEIARARLARRWARARHGAAELGRAELDRRVQGSRRAPTLEDRLAELEALDADAFRGVRRAILSRARLWLGAAGPESAEETNRRLDEALAALPPGSLIEPTEAPSFLEPPHTRVHLVDLPGAERSSIRIAVPGTRLLAPDEAALALFSESLGLGVRAEAARELSEKHGLRTTLAPAFRPEWERSGRFELEFSAPHEAVPEVVAALANELRAARAPMTAEQLAAARDALLAKDEAREADTRDSLARDLELALHGYPGDFWERRRRRVRALSAEEVSAGVARYLDPDRLVVVVVGPADELAEGLERIGPVTRDSRAPEPLVEELFAALGGREPWRATRFVESELTHSARGTDTELHTWRDLDAARLRIEPAGTPPVVIGVDGDSCWQRRGDSIFDMAPDVSARMAGACWYDPLALMRQIARGGSQSTVEIGLRRIELVAGPGAGIWIELDAKGRPARLGRREADGQVVHRIEAWQELAGLQVPAKIVREGDGGWTRSLRSLVVHPELDATLFEKR